MDEAVAHCRRGLGIWQWASTDAGAEPDVVLTCAGDVPTLETLAAAGLDRVTVSLDSLDDEVFIAMNDVGYPVAKVLEGIEAAAAAGLTPVKVNMVVKKGVNAQRDRAAARQARDRAADHEALLKLADDNLYRAKHAGRNRYKD